MVIGDFEESVRGTKTNWSELRRKNGNKRVSTDGKNKKFFFHFFKKEFC